jgi:hypothetical protein
VAGRTVVVILGGGRGSRLFPLTAVRAKPAVPLGGKYRLIDIPISNAINSGLREIFVLTQFNSASLNAHVSSRPTCSTQFSHGAVEILAAEQTDTSLAWYQGTADAVRQHLHRFLLDDVEQRPHPVRRPPLPHGLPRADRPPRGRRRHHRLRASGCAATSASAFGIIGPDAAGMIRDFREKPRPADLGALEAPDRAARSGACRRSPTSRQHGRLRVPRRGPARPSPTWASSTSARTSCPRRRRRPRVAAHRFDGYWEDIGTVKQLLRSQPHAVPGRPAVPPLRPLRPPSTPGPGSAAVGAARRARRPRVHRRRLPRARLRHRPQQRHRPAQRAVSRQPRRRQHPDGGGLLRVRDAAALAPRAGADRHRRGRQHPPRDHRQERPHRRRRVIHGDPDRPDMDHEDWVVRDGIVIVRKSATIPPGSVL